MATIIFDLFETLVTEWGRPKYTTRAIAADLGVEHQAFAREKSALSTAHFRGKFPGTVQILEEILKNMNFTRDKNLLEEIAAKREECKRKCFDVIEPKILEMLSALKAKNHKLGLISNCSPEEIGGFWDSGLRPFFDAVVMSCDVGMVKPDAEIYRHCLSLLGVGPDGCLFVGDGGSNELDGARHAGLTPLKAVWFTKHFVAPRSDGVEEVYPVLGEPVELLGFM